MFTEKLLQAFLDQFKDHRIEVIGTSVGGVTMWVGRIVGPDSSGEEVAVAETSKLNLADVPCALADDLRNKLGAAQQVKDRKKLPDSQRVALEKGIPGIVRHRPKKPKEIVPKPTLGAREG